MIEPSGRSEKPIQEGTENEEVADAANRLPASAPLLEAATCVALLLLRSINGELRVELIVAFQEVFVLGIDWQRNGLLGLVEIHDGRGS